MDTIIKCPNGKGTGEIFIHLDRIVQIESRFEEIRSVTWMKAPDLLSDFTIAWNELHKSYALLHKEYLDAKTELDKIRSVILLDRVPEYLKEKGLTSGKSPMGSEDLRSAIIQNDSDYQAIQERLNAIESFREYIQGKLKSMQMAYEAVKKVLSENNMKSNSMNSSGLNSDEYLMRKY